MVFVRRYGAISSRDEREDDGEKEEDAEDGEADEFLRGVAREEKRHVRGLPINGREEIADASAEAHHERVRVERLCFGEGERCAWSWGKERIHENK